VFNKVLNYSPFRIRELLVKQIYFESFVEGEIALFFVLQSIHTFKSFFPLSVIFIVFFSLIRPVLFTGMLRVLSDCSCLEKERYSSTTFSSFSRIDTELRHIICIMYGPPLAKDKLS
jgi:hypothetical protein